MLALPNSKIKLSSSRVPYEKSQVTTVKLTWSACVLQDDRISGVTQLYSVEEDITQCISSHAVCFSTYNFADNPQPSTVLCVASRESQDHGKVEIQTVTNLNRAK